MAQEVTHNLRADAQENRDRILDAARALFSERGLDVSMREVARCAEVGPATLYRRFPTKQALIDDEDSPFFTTSHFDGHLSVLVRGRDLPNLSYGELAEVVQDAWLARASPRRAAQWLDARGLDGRSHGTVRDETDF